MYLVPFCWDPPFWIDWSIKTELFRIEIEDKLYSHKHTQQITFCTALCSLRIQDVNNLKAVALSAGNSAQKPNGYVVVNKHNALSVLMGY